MPRVTVILTSRNHARYLRESIDSVLNQSFVDFKLIVWDDASTDDSWEIVQSYSDRRIEAYRNTGQKRAIYGLNKVISELTKSEYIAIHHSDDAWEVDKLARQVALLDANRGIGAVFTSASIIDEKGDLFTDHNHYYYDIFNQVNRSRFGWLNFFFYKGNALCHSSVLIRRKCYKRCGLYRYGLAQLTDFEIWVRLCLQYEIKVLPEKLVKFRISDDEEQASGSSPEKHIRISLEYFQILSHFKSLGNHESFFKVFPEALHYERGRKTDLDFALAMVCIEQGSGLLYKLFGLNLLYELLNNATRAAAIKRNYGFSYIDLIDISGKYDIFQWVSEKYKITSSVFIDVGFGFSEENMISKYVIAQNMDGYFSLSFDLNEIWQKNMPASEGEGVKIRWDPVEGIQCRCQVVKIQVDGKCESAVPLNKAYSFNGWDYFLNDDPSYVLDRLFDKPKVVTIHFHIKSISASEIAAMIAEIEEHRLKLESSIKNLKKENSKLKNRISYFESDNN